MSISVSEVRRSEKGDGKYQENEAHSTGSSSQGIMGITWAQNGSAASAMRAAGAKGCGRFGPGSLS